MIASEEPKAGFPTYIDLATARLVAEGHKRNVYEHDAFPGMLIKVVRPELIDEDGQLRLTDRKPKFYRRPTRLGAFLSNDREIREFLALRVKPASNGQLLPIQKFWGFVDTDMGLGLLVERLCAPDGGLAPTVNNLVLDGRFTPAHYANLRAFYGELARLHVCVANMHRHNIVFVGEIGKGGRFVGIDGLGDSNLIPLSSWFKWYNARRLQRHAEKIYRFINAHSGTSNNPSIPSRSET
jgi:hypothetical protein